MARQEAAQALDYLCAERESRAQDVLQLKDSVPLSKHKEALSAVSEQLAQTLQELREEKMLRGQAEEQTARLEAKLEALKDSVSKEEHEKVKVRRIYVKNDVNEKSVILSKNLKTLKCCNLSYFSILYVYVVLNNTFFFNTTGRAAARPTGQ